MYRKIYIFDNTTLHFIISDVFLKDYNWKVYVIYKIQALIATLLKGQWIFNAQNWADILPM